MPLVKKPKKGKKVRRPKGNRVATAPTRDVIINISTAKPRASKTLKPAMTKRSEDLSGRIKDFEISQSQFRQTQLIKEQASKMGLIDKRLSVLTDIIDNERTVPLVQKRGGMPPMKQEQIPQPGEKKQSTIFEAFSKQKGRPKLTEDEKKARAESRELARIQSLTTPVVGVEIRDAEALMTGEKEKDITAGGGGIRADLVGASPLPKGVGSEIPLAEVEGVDAGAEEKKIITITKKKPKKDKKK